jgi:hypothetical protein
MASAWSCVDYTMAMCEEMTSRLVRKSSHRDWYTVRFTIDTAIGDCDAMRCDRPEPAPLP